ncbi:MAG: DUF6443 domain-containing protein [Bacteroidales bacterium]|nr:DUF6443 domain-containing protein [Bacteroidales bacterium]
MKTKRTLYMMAALLVAVTLSLLGGARCAAQKTSVSPTVLEWPAGDTSVKYVTIQSGGRSWETDSLVLSNHFQLSAISGTSGASISVTPISQNTSPYDITGEAYFYTTVSGAVLSLVHHAAAYSISAAPASLHWLRDETDAKAVTITANGPWTASVPSGCGFQLSASQGSGSGSVNVSPQGISTTGRAATLTLSCGTATAYVSLVQDVSDERLSIAGNWILSRTYTEADDATRINDITFYNGLGYPEQVVRVGASPVSGRNVVTPVEYDAQLRADERTYLPFVPQASSGIQEEPTATVLTQQAAYWNGKYSGEGAYASSRTERTSALDRPESTLKPGSAWANGGHSVVYGYAANASGEVRRYVLNAAGTLLSRSGYWNTGTLYKDTVTDEDGCAVTTFTDRLGRTVMQRRSPSAGVYADTYSVYDSWGNLAVVLSPEGNNQTEDESDYLFPQESDVNSSELAQYAYLYRSDAQGRIQMKKLPGKAPERFVYDRVGRLVMSQDGRQKDAGGWWTVFEYDALGREVRRGLYRDTARSGEAARAYWQGIGDAGGTLPQAATVLYECAYGSYANAVSDNLSFCAVTGVTATPDLLRIRGLKTWEKVAVLDDDITTVNGYVRRAFWYDTLGRPVQTVEKRPDGTLLRTSSKLGFRGEELVRVESFGNWSLRTDNTFDDRLLLTESASTLSDSNQTYTSVQMSAEYTYDDLGRLVKTTYGNGVADSLSYDLRGWRIAQNASIGNATFFSTTLHYADPPLGTALYSGNISAMEWMPGPLPDYMYVFNYDKMSRLTGATDYVGEIRMEDESYTERNITYDLNTNLTGMVRRKGTVSYMPHGGQQTQTFSYTLAGNRRSSYTYDINGNMTADGSGWTLAYNLLNLPASAEKNAGTSLLLDGQWTYLADGTKIRASYGCPKDFAPFIGNSAGNPVQSLIDTLIVPDPGEPIIPPVLNDRQVKTWSYVGPFRLYSESLTTVSSLESVAAVGGRFVMDGSSLAQRYYITDYLGSTRVVLDNSGNVRERYDYFPYGEKNPVTVANTGNTDYLYTGKESQNALFGINWYDSGARFQTTDGIFTGIDPLAEKYYHLSPYAYCAGNPVNLIDPTGMDGYLVVWATDNGNVGHAGFAIDNYKEIQYYDEDGNPQTRIEKTGTVSYFDLWPGNEGGVSIHNASKDVVAFYTVERETTIESIINNDVIGNEGRAPDGVLRIQADYQTDKQTLERIEQAMENKVYNGRYRNCSDFAKIGVESSAKEKIKAQEFILFRKSTTPNKLFRETAKRPYSEMLKNPGEKINKSFIKGVK